MGRPRKLKKYSIKVRNGKKEIEVSAVFPKKDRGFFKKVINIISEKTGRKKYCVHGAVWKAIQKMPDFERMDSAQIVSELEKQGIKNVRKSTVYGCIKREAIKGDASAQKWLGAPRRFYALKGSAPIEVYDNYGNRIALRTREEISAYNLYRRIVDSGLTGKELQQTQLYKNFYRNDRGLVLRKVGFQIDFKPKPAEKTFSEKVKPRDSLTIRKYLSDEARAGLKNQKIERIAQILGRYEKFTNLDEFMHDLPRKFGMHATNAEVMQAYDIVSAERNKTKEQKIAPKFTKPEEPVKAETAKAQEGEKIVKIEPITATDATGNSIVLDTPAQAAAYQKFLSGNINPQEKLILQRKGFSFIKPAATALPEKQATVEEVLKAQRPIKKEITERDRVKLEKIVNSIKRTFYERNRSIEAVSNSLNIPYESISRYINQYEMTFGEISKDLEIIRSKIPIYAKREIAQEKKDAKAQLEYLKRLIENNKKTEDLLYKKGLNRIEKRLGYAKNDKKYGYLLLASSAGIRPGVSKEFAKLPDKLRQMALEGKGMAKRMAGGMGESEVIKHEGLKQIAEENQGKKYFIFDKMIYRNDKIGHENTATPLVNEQEAEEITKEAIKRNVGRFVVKRKIGNNFEPHFNVFEIANIEGKKLAIPVKTATSAEEHSFEVIILKK